MVEPVETDPVRFVVRAPRPDEAEALADVHLRAWAETYAGLFPERLWGPDARAQRVRMWTRLCAGDLPDDRRVAVAEIDGEPVGIAGTGPARGVEPPRDRELYFVYLLAHAQGSGAGQALLDAVLGGDPASLWVVDGNARAIAFYRRNGFAFDGARERLDEGIEADELRMVR